MGLSLVRKEKPVKKCYGYGGPTRVMCKACKSNSKHSQDTTKTAGDKGNEGIVDDAAREAVRQDAMSRSKKSKASVKTLRKQLADSRQKLAEAQDIVQRISRFGVSARTPLTDVERTALDLLKRNICDKLGIYVKKLIEPFKNMEHYRRVTNNKGRPFEYDVKARLKLDTVKTKIRKMDDFRCQKLPEFV